MGNAPKRRFNILKALDQDELAALYGFFDTPNVDYAGLNALIEERFGDQPAMLKMWQLFASSMETIDSGEPLVLDAQPMIAKNVLSLIVNMGLVQAARKFVLACVNRYGLDPLLEIYSMLTLADTQIERMTILDKTWMDYQVYDRGHPTTMILMCGNSHRFGVELNAVAIWLESLPVNVIYIRDFDLALYLTGVRSLGNLDETIARLRKDLDAMGTKRTVVMGNSGGVYGALMFGNLLKVDQVLCFAGPTSLEGGNNEASERPVYQRIQNLVDEGRITVPDLRAQYAENGIRVRYFFGMDYAFDVEHSKNFAGLPNVSLEGIKDFSKHIVIGHMARTNILNGIFAEAAGIQSPATNS